MKQSSLRTLSALLFVLLASLPVSAKLITTTGTKPSIGNGNSGSPYEIRTAEELRWFVNYENTRHWYPNDYAVLRNDIDLSTICGPDKGSWIPLGYREESGAKDHWYGNLDGNNCKITGLYIDGNDFSSSAILGFCGTVTSATIKNLVVEGDIVNAPNTAGGLVGYVKEDKAVFSNCVSEVNISTSGNHYIGGLVGYFAKDSEMDMKCCTYNGIIKVPAPTGNTFPVGALVGLCQGFGEIYFCSSYSHPDNSQALPMIGYLTDNLKDTKVNFNMHLGSYFIKDIYDCYVTIDNNYLCGWPFCDTMIKTSSDVGNNKTFDNEQFASGAACYQMNQDIIKYVFAGSRSFYQNIGSDPIPYAVSFGHEAVLKAKDYIDCENYNEIYNNTGLDTNKKHTFDAEHDRCTVCHEVLNPDFASKDAEGYFLIGNKAQMLWFVELCNSSATPNYKMKLTADIDMEHWVTDPIHEFWGQIEGQGHVLNNVYISSNDQYVGLVGHLKLNPDPYARSQGAIRNLTMNGYVRGKEYTQYLGAFAGKSDGNESKKTSLTNLRNDCQVIYDSDNTGIYNNTRIGGIVGQLDGRLIDCLNNGLIYDNLSRTKETDDGIAGIAGRKTKNSEMWGVINNGEVGCAYDSYKNRGAVANNEYNGNYEQLRVGYVKDIPPTKGGFYYSNIGTYSTGASQQADALDRIRLASGEFCLSYLEGWGQKIGVDEAPYPIVSDAHPKVYKKRFYYNCTDYSDYSNVNEDGDPRDHEYNDAHYCTHCYHLEPGYIAQDDDKAYLIETPEQWNTFAYVVNNAAAGSTVMAYASARLAHNLDFTSETGFTKLNMLNSKLDGAGYIMSFSDEAAPSSIVEATSAFANIRNLYVEFPTEDASLKVLCGEMNGTMSGCSVTNGVPTQVSNGLVSDCAGVSQRFGDFKGCYKRMFLKLDDTAFRIYSGSNADEDATYDTYTSDIMTGGYIAYMLSHSEPAQECLWGQVLGTDAYPRIICGLTPSSTEFVAKTTTYSRVNPAGIIEYINAGALLEHAPGYYRVTADAESFPDMKNVTNFIVDNGDGTCTAKVIEMDPSFPLYLPLHVETGKFIYDDSREYEAGKIVPVMFPVDMPFTNIRGRVCMLDHYDSVTKTVYFDSNLDKGSLAANTPALVIADGGKLLVDYELADAIVMPMDGASCFEAEGIQHFTSYHGESLGDGYVTINGEQMACFSLDYDNEGNYCASLDWNGGGQEMDQLAPYIAFPSSTPGMSDYTSNSQVDELAVAFTGETELTVSDTMQVDLFALPYGVIPAGQWEQSAHSSARIIFFGNDPNGYSYSDLSGYREVILRGTPNQPYKIYMTAGNTKAELKYDAAALEPTEITLDESGEYTLDLSSYRYVHLIEIISGNEEYIAYDASGTGFKTLPEDGVALSGFGTVPSDYDDYAFYDATRVKSWLNLQLKNPNALVLAGDNIKGEVNLLRRTSEQEHGYCASSLSIADGHDLCYDFSVHCDNSTFTCDNLSAGDSYFITVLPIDVNNADGIYTFDKYDDGYLCFKSADKTIPAYTPIVVKVTNSGDVSIAGSDLRALEPSGLFNLTKLGTSETVKYGFATRQQTAISLGDNDEVSPFDIYSFDSKELLFTKEVESLSLSPFRMIVALPKPAADPAAQQARTSSGPSRAGAANPVALGIKIDGTILKTIPTSIQEITIENINGVSGYNLQGLPVSSSHSGIIIRNGKKVIQ